MSGYKMHLLFYLCILLASYACIRVDDALMVLGGLTGLIYCLIPDIDTRKSFLGHRVYNATIVLLVVSLMGLILLREGYYLALVLCSAILLLMLLFARHRGFTHSIPAAFLLSLPLLLINESLFPFALSGYVSHLLLDLLSDIYK
ncbi:MAG: metal-dependent hydrolase [Candidatus Altiarchaeota archaeon]|nr:metal-dependent hydrolase [Candidatus Altiarchaeota archaeon]